MSSIFENNELINQFLKITTVPIKVAQTAPATPADPNVIKTLATKLINNLDKSTNISTDKPDTALYMRDVQNLNSFISFLKLENISYNGIGLITPNYAALDEARKKMYVPYRWQGGIDAFPLNSTIGIYKEGLIAYLKMLMETASKTGNYQGRLLTTMLTRLINQANNELKMGIKTQDLVTSTDQRDAVEHAMLDNTPLDSINETMSVENPMSPVRDKGTIIITPKDLKGKLSFDALVRKLKITKGGKTLGYEEFDDASFCDIIRILHARATSYAYRRGAFVDKTYLQLTTDLANTYGCDVKSSGGAGGMQPVSYHQVGGGGHLSGPAQKAAASLAMKLPLLEDRIDFPRITNWLRFYSENGQLLNIDAATQAAIGHAQQILEQIDTTHRMPSQSLSQEASSVAASVIANTLGNNAAKAGAPVTYLHLLQQLLSLMGTILSAFKNNVYDSLSAQDMKDELDEQIGAGGSSLYNVNIDRINTWLMDLPSALQQIKNQGF